MEYRGTSDYHTVCAGASSCEKKVAWQDTTCNGTGYLDRSNYMLMNYRCIASKFKYIRAFELNNPNIIISLYTKYIECEMLCVKLQNTENKCKHIIMCRYILIDGYE